jgi:hypothetical protein
MKQCHQRKLSLIGCTFRSNNARLLKPLIVTILHRQILPLIPFTLMFAPPDLPSQFSVTSINPSNLTFSNTLPALYNYIPNRSPVACLGEMYPVLKRHYNIRTTRPCDVHQSLWVALGSAGKRGWKTVTSRRMSDNQGH